MGFFGRYKGPGQWGMVVGLALGCLIHFPMPAAGQARTRDWRWDLGKQREGFPMRFAAQTPKQIDNRRRVYQDLSAQDEARRKRNIQKWKALPLEKRKVLRKRMDRWKKLPPEERALFRRRFDQWRRLPPEERKNLRRRLDKWERLSPKERDEVLRRFRNP